MNRKKVMIYFAMTVTCSVLTYFEVLSSFKMAKVSKLKENNYINELNGRDKYARFAGKKGAPKFMSRTKNVNSSLVDENEVIANVKLFNLSQKMEPNESYDSIQCRKSANFFVETTLCVHDIHKDIHVSGSIWNSGVWEPQILGSFMQYVNKHPDWLVFDIGAQIGQYSLFAAKMGRRVISVEPFHDNILRLHKAAKLENLTDNIMLFTNAISNKPNEIKKLTRNQNNIGGQSLWPLKDLAINRSMNTSQDKYLVETIRLDDLVKYLPVGINNASTNIRQKAIMKIDIEGFEPYAFQKASKLFDAVDICVMFMEWGHKAQETSTNVALIDEMVTFLKQHGLKPYDDAGLLTRSWSSWSWDIVWRKDGY